MCLRDYRIQGEQTWSDIQKEKEKKSFFFILSAIVVSATAIILAKIGLNLGQWFL